jgi:hypothetical protein
LKRALPRHYIELFDAAPDEVDLLHPLKVLAYVNGVVQDLRLLRVRRALRRECAREHE